MHVCTLYIKAKNALHIECVVDVCATHAALNLSLVVLYLQMPLDCLYELLKL